MSALRAKRVEPADVRPITSSARIQAALRDEIVALRLTPGMVLAEKDLAETFGVSRTPVREALLRLADEHLVDILPQIGTFVSRINLAAVRDAMVIRQALERVTVREAARHAAAADIKQLRGILRDQVTGEARAFHEADEALHEAIAVMARHPNLWRVVRREKASVDRFRLLTLPLPGRISRLIEQHTAVVEAIAAHDADAAERAMQAHLLDVVPGFEALANTHPEFFDAENPLPTERARRAGRT